MSLALICTAAGGGFDPRAPFFFFRGSRQNHLNVVLCQEYYLFRGFWDCVLEFLVLNFSETDGLQCDSRTPPPGAPKWQIWPFNIGFSILQLNRALFYNPSALLL